jgi:hypothetical protein
MSVLSVFHAKIPPPLCPARLDKAFTLVLQIHFLPNPVTAAIISFLSVCLPIETLQFPF